MKNKRGDEEGKKKNRKKNPLKSSIKTITTAAALAGSLFISSPSEAKVVEFGSSNVSIKQRVRIVRDHLEKIFNNQSQDRIDTKNNLSRHETKLAQWNNWYNWPDFNNWDNWSNWNNYWYNY